jgi:hypothetical protein
MPLASVLFAVAVGVAVAVAVSVAITVIPETDISDTSPTIATAKTVF